MSTDATMYPGVREFPAYYEVDNNLVRVAGPLDMPEVYRGGGEWKPYDNVMKFRTMADPLTKSETKDFMDMNDKLKANRKK